MSKRYWLILSAIIMILIGIMRGIGGIALLLKGSQLDTGIPIIATHFEIYIVAIGLILIGVLFLFSSFNLLRKYSKISWYICFIILILFLIGGLLNGFLLFGQPLDQGQMINLVAVIFVGLFLFLGKSALKSIK